jgi:hypothetical protein
METPMSCYPLSGVKAYHTSVNVILGRFWAVGRA